MRILFVAQWFPPDLGALPARLTEMANVWAAAGHSVTVVTAFPHHPTGIVPAQYHCRWVVREKCGEIDVIRCRLWALPNRRMWQRTACQLSFAATSVLLALFRPPRPDVVVVSSPPFFTVGAAWIFSRVRRAPLIFEVRDLWPAVFAEMGVMRRGAVAYRILEAMEKLFYRAAASVVVVTRAFREDLVARGVPGEKVAIIPNGADIATWSRAGAPRFRSSLGGDGKFLVTYVGVHGVATGLEQILDAADILRNDTRVAFAFVGEGAERERVMRMADERKLPNVTFHPAVAKEDMPDIYASSDACIVCLRPVPFLEKFIPSKIFEILACGKPLIAALGGEAAEIVSAASNFVVHPGDASAIAATASQLASSPARAAAAGERGRAYVSAHFDRKLLASQYVEVMRRVV